MTTTEPAPTGATSDRPAPNPAVPTDVGAERDRRRRELALGYRLFAALRWGDLGDGHITARDPEHLDHFWVLGGMVPFERVTVDDLVLIRPDGTTSDGHRRYNTTAYNIHGPIHDARPDVVAAAHTHTAWGTPFSTERRLVQPINQEACAFYDDHSLFDDEEVQVISPAGGSRIAAALGSNRAVILANHGLLTTGGSVAEAVGAFVWLDRVCEVHLKATGARPISSESARLARDNLRLPGSFADAFAYLVARHLDEVAP